MATTETYYVNTDSTAGGDGTTNGTSGSTRAFATLAAAETALRQNLVSTDKVLVIRCSAPSGVADTTQVSFASANWATDNTRYVEIVPNTDADRYTPAGWKTDRYRLDLAITGNVSGFAVTTKKVQIRGVQMRVTRTVANGNHTAFLFEPPSTDDTVSCILEGRFEGSCSDLGGSDSYTVMEAKGNVNYMFRNHVIVALLAGGTGTRVLFSNSNIWNVSNALHYNGTLIGCTGIGSLVAGNAQYQYKNCLFFRNGATSTKRPDFRSGSTHNAFDESSLSNVGSNSLQGQTFTFENAAGGDFRLASTDAGARDLGTDLSADATLPVTTDAIGTARPQGSAVDIGAHEYIGAVDLTALEFTEQPQNAWDGEAIPGPITVRALDADGDLDTSATSEVTLTRVGTGTLAGDAVKNLVAGVAVFDDLNIVGSGTHSLKANASGYPEATSDSFKVATGTGVGGSALIAGGSVLSRPIRRAEASAALRRIFMLIENDAGEAWDGSITGVKAKLSVHGGSETDSPADIVRVAGKLHYVTPTDSYVDIDPGSFAIARVPAASGRREAIGVAEIIPADSYAAAASEAGIAKAVVRAANGLDGYKFEKKVGDNVLELTIPGVGTVNVPCVFNANSPAVEQLGE
jgi:hypothetical protein